MKKIILITILFLINMIEIHAQALSGLNTGTTSPNALLEIKKYDESVARNGVHVPYISLAEYNAKRITMRGQAISQLIGVVDNNASVKYVYWNGNKWIELIIDKPLRTIAPDVTVVMGSGFSAINTGIENYRFTDYLRERKILFNSASSNNVTVNSNNEITVAKSGLYKIELYSCVYRDGNTLNSQFSSNLGTYSRRFYNTTIDLLDNWTQINNGKTGTFDVVIKKGGVEILTGGTSYSSATEVYANIAVTGVYRLEADSVITATITRLVNGSRTDHIPLYDSHGQNSLILTRLSE